jgi:hypothetical protein
MVERLALQPASNEILDEFERVRNRFLSTFDLVEQDPTIDAYFDERGLYSHPVVQLPFTPEGRNAALAVTKETKYPLPFIQNRMEQIKLSDPFATAWAFTSTPYRLNFIFDINDSLNNMCGSDFADRTMSTASAHERGHSVFHSKPTILTATTALEQTVIYEYQPLCGVVQRVYDESKPIRYTPQWIEEAIATYIAGNVFRPEIPKGEGRVFEPGVFGPDDYWLDEHYLIYSPYWPEWAGFVGGAIAGQTLETLDLKVPGTIDKMFGIAKGTVDSDEFRADLRTKVGSKLFNMMFNRHSYERWAAINNGVINLET